MNSQRGDAALRRCRVSLPLATYFVTLCVRDRRVGITEGGIPTRIQREITALERDAHWRILGAVLMPDHVHLCVRLGMSMTLPRTIARLKSRTRSELDAAGLEWQGNFFEHRLRPNDSVRDVLQYLFLNPYRAGLVSPEWEWPWFWLGDDEKGWFMPRTDDGRPLPEWLA